MASRELTGIIEMAKVSKKILKTYNELVQIIDNLLMSKIFCFKDKNTFSDLSGDIY